MEDLFHPLFPSCGALSALACSRSRREYPCKCRFDTGHEGPHRCRDCGLLFATHDPLPEPPSGPAAPVPAPKAGSVEAYELWRATAEGTAAWEWIASQARGMLERGDRRIAIGLLMAECRQVRRLSVDQRYGPYLTDDLCRDRPAFLHVIERRRRKPKCSLPPT